MSVKDADGHKVLYHPERVNEWMKEGKCSPLHVEIGLTNRCNHRCSFCTLDWATHGSNDIDKDVMLQTIEDFAEMDVKSVYFAGEGEPTLHKHLPLFITELQKRNIKVAMSTNGAMFKKELIEQTLGGFSWIRFSVDAATPETYAKLHGVAPSQFGKVIENIKECVRIKRENGYKVDIGVQAIFEPENALEIEQFGVLMKTIGVDNIQIKPAHNHPNSSYNPGIYDFSHDEIRKRLEALETEDFLVVVRLKSLERLKEERTFEECHGFHFYALISGAGDVVPCNVFYKEPEYIFGNINEKTFKEIWRDEKRLEIIQKIKGTCNKFCGDYRCRLDVINRYLQRVRFPEANDEFI